MVKDDIFISLDAATGKLLKRGRLGSGKGKVYASPVGAEGKIYLGTLDGKLLVLEATGEWTVTRTNELGEEIWATPAIADGHLYVRTRSKLYNFVAPASPPAGDTVVEETSAP